MITIIKLDSAGNHKLQYQGTIIAQSPNSRIVKAYWTYPPRDLGYTQFETGDCFIEYYYTDRWFNIFDITDRHGTRKGWYCNIAEPAIFLPEHIKQKDLLLDVWISPTGQPRILDEDEFAAAPLSELQRDGAQQGLHTLLHMLTTRQEVFTVLPTQAT